MEELLGSHPSNVRKTEPSRLGIHREQVSTMAMDGHGEAEET